MRRAGIFSFACGCVLLISCACVRGQEIVIDTASIGALVHQWNFANNNHSAERLNSVYGDRLLFYTQTLPEAKAIALKEEFFRKKPAFRQTIASPIAYTPYSSGVIKCDFVKEVWEGTGWKTYPSYLLVSTDENGGYEIVGESDNATDRTLRYDLLLGEPVEFAVAPPPATGAANQAASAQASQQTDFASEIRNMLSTPFLSSLFTSDEVVSVPKRYVYMLAALLLAGGLLIFTADSIRARRRKKSRVRRRKDAADHVIAELSMQSAFEAFVVTLFDPLLFTHHRARAEKVYAGNAVEGESRADLEFEYAHKETQFRFAIKCIYFRNALARELQLFLPSQRQVFRDFEGEHDMALYFILGIGGSPDDPKELYLLPARDVKGGRIKREALRPYAKSGMFYVNRKSRSLQ